MRSSNITANVEKGNHLAMLIKSPLRFLVVLGFAGLVAMGASFGSVSADGATHQIAGDYTVEPAVIAGPPVVENGVATVAGTVTLDSRGSQVGPTVIDFTCALGADGAPNVCQGTYLFDGTIRGKTGTYRATLKDWTAGGDEAFTSARFKLIPGSGTGGLSTLVVAEGFVQRDETVEPAVGVYWGKVRFKAEAGDLSGYSASELFHMEAVGKITIEELIAELDRRNQQ